MALIFSYGTLVNKRTREYTGVSGKAVPARVKGYIRRWSWHHPTQGRTALGVERADASINGMVVEIPDEEMPKFNKREFKYTRELIPQENIEYLDESFVGEVWIYVPENPELADDEHPIVQTYIDPIIEALLEVSEDFAKEFIQTTKDWALPWINDREEPRYPRALKNIDTKKVDALLKMLERP